jgi:hypothetical protein
MRSRKVSPLTLTKAIDVALDELQTTPENPHLQPDFAEIPLKTSSIVEIGQVQRPPRNSPVFPHRRGLRASPIGASECLHPHSLTLELA